MKFPEKFFEILVNKNQIYTYAVPARLEGTIQIGQGVQVPLRKGVVSGYVIKEVSKPVFECKEIVSVLYPEIYFSQAQIELCEWVAKKYLSFPATAFKLILPK
jgi:primosomal protein N' (replication factor Y)